MTPQFVLEFAEICKSRGELHFPDIETQLADIRTQYWNAEACAERSSGTPRGARSPSDDDVTLVAGDVYITRHSNLGRAHVVFHLVAGSDEEDLATRELNSRHQVREASSTIAVMGMDFVDTRKSTRFQRSMS